MNTKIKELRKILGYVSTGKISFHRGCTMMQERTNSDNLDFMIPFIMELRRLQGREIDKDKHVKYGSVGDGIINHWVRYRDESWTQVYIVEAPTRKEAEDFVADKLWGGLAGYSTQSAYDCTGQPFNCAASSIRAGDNRWLVTQYGGLDL